MSFTFNNLNGSSKPNATVACSTNSPSKSNLNTDDIVKKSGEKSKIACTASGSGADDNSSLFVFGNHSEKNFDFKTSENYNFVLNSNSFEPNLSHLKFSANINFFDNKEKMEPKLEDKTNAESDLDNNDENSNENSAKDEELKNEEQKQDNNVPNGEMVVVKTIVAEFKDVISSFIKERTEAEKKNVLLENRITLLEEEVKNLKAKDSKGSSITNSTKDNDAAKSTELSVYQQPPQEAPVFVSRHIPVLSPSVESSTLKSAFGSTSSLFGSTSAPVFNCASTNSFGSASSLLNGNDSTIRTSVFNPSPNISTQIQGGNQLFGISVPTPNLNGNKSFAPERKKANTQKLFSDEAVTNFLNAQKEPAMNNGLAKINTGNPLKKMANGQESSEQSQNMPTKEAFEVHLKRTIEFSVKKAMEEYWEHFKTNTSEANSKKFNSGNLF